MLQGAPISPALFARNLARADRYTESGLLLHWRRWIAGCSMPIMPCSARWRLYTAPQMHYTDYVRSYRLFMFICTLTIFDGPSDKLMRTPTIPCRLVLRPLSCDAIMIAWPCLQESLQESRIKSWYIYTLCIYVILDALDDPKGQKDSKLGNTEASERLQSFSVYTKFSWQSTF